MTEGAFQFGPRDRRGLVAGVRTAQAALLSAALVAAVLFGRHGGPLDDALAVVCPLLATAGGWVPIDGRTLDQWVPIGARHGLRRALGAVHGEHLYGGMALVASTRRGETFGVLVDRGRGTASAAFRIAGSGFDLLAAEEQLAKVAAWSAVLASLAREATTLHRLQWIERTLPTGRLADVAPSTDAAGTAGAAASYRQLLRAERATLAHELLLVVTVRAPRRGIDGAVEEALATEVASLLRRCEEAGFPPTEPLAPAALASAVRAGAARMPAPRFGVASPWPAVRTCRWRAFEAGGMWHATYWIAEWPRHVVGPDFLLPLLLEGGDRRSVSLVMAPVAPSRAVRTAEHARTARAADAALRARHGFAATARARREEEAVIQRETELSAGHAGYRFSGYVTVHAASPEGLTAAERRVEQAAALSRLTLRRLDGEHDEGFLTSLPLGRGLR